MENIYIGARYVPLFYTAPDGTNAWTANVEYEPLTIVTDLNQSYTSKIPVPASVGRPSENPDYWILTGAYNAQVEQYRQDVVNYQQSVDDDVERLDGRIDDSNNAISYLNGRIGTKFLFIGDSYDTIYTNQRWSDICAGLLGLTSDDYYTVAAGGYGFAPANNLKWKDLVEADTNIPEDIDTIVIGGGLNDSGVASSVLIPAAAEFNTYIRGRFTNLKTVYLSWMGMTYTSRNAFIASNDACAFYNYIAASNRWIFTRGVEHVLFDPSLMNVAAYPDKAHPSTSGVFMLAEQLYQAIVAGCSKTMVNKAGFATVNASLGYSGSTKAFYTRVIDGDVKLYDAETTFSGSSSALSGFVELYTFADMWSLLPYQFYTPVTVRYGSTIIPAYLAFTTDLTLSLYLNGATIPANTQFVLGPWKMEAVYR